MNKRLHILLSKSKRPMTYGPNTSQPCDWAHFARYRTTESNITLAHLPAESNIVHPCHTSRGTAYTLTSLRLKCWPLGKHGKTNHLVTNRYEVMRCSRVEHECGSVNLQDISLTLQRGPPCVSNGSTSLSVACQGHAQIQVCRFGSCRSCP